MTTRATDAQVPGSGTDAPNLHEAALAGVGLKPQHYQHILEHRPQLGWFEIHPDNYLCEGGPRHHYLTAIREHYPISMHSVGLSLGSTQRPDSNQLQRLKQLVDRYQPFMVSEHVSWSLAGPSLIDQNTQIFHSDLLPLPYTKEALQVLGDNIQITQEALRRPLLMENPSTYLEFNHADFSEPEFLNLLVAQSGCGLLMDINNVYVCAQNHGFDAFAYLDAINWQAVGEIHLAGHAIDTWNDQTIRIDDHGSSVCEEVWELYRYAIQLAGCKPTLIEWDSRIPEFEVLEQQAQQALLICQQQGVSMEVQDGTPH